MSRDEPGRCRLSQYNEGDSESENGNGNGNGNGNVNGNERVRMKERTQDKGSQIEGTWMYSTQRRTRQDSQIPVLSSKSR